MQRFCRFFGMVLIAASAWAQTYDLVLANGRVMDPESGLDAARHVGIRGGKIAAISASPLKGLAMVDAAGLVIAPGFIDLHSHGQTAENYRFKARDGVTTALELEVGAWPVAPWYAERQGKALIHYGVTSGHIPVRMAVMEGSSGFLPRGAAVSREASEEQRKEIVRRVRQGLDDGALGIGMGIQYVPKASREEVLDLFQLGADRKRTSFVHVRQMGAVEPGVIDALQEVLADSLVTGASLHLVHITSMGLRLTPLCLRMIEGARRQGLDVTTEAYPYTAAMTGLETAIFSEGWQERLGISHGDLQWVQTGERLTAETFARYRKQGGLVVIHMIPEDVARFAVGHPLVMIASDGLLENGKGHPRGAGTFARVLGRYVREQRALSLMDALRKMTLMPAQRLETAVPQMRSKGRIKVGADADVTVFDPALIADRATFDAPAQYSEGIRHVLVDGTFVVRDGELKGGVSPGKPIRIAP
jgi:dihydroorotase